MKQVWSDSDPETDAKTPDEIFQTFIDAKNFFEPELKMIDESSQKIEEQVQNNNESEEQNIKNNNMLARKTEREENDQSEIGPQPLIPPKRTYTPSTFSREKESPEEAKSA